MAGFPECAHDVQQSPSVPSGGKAEIGIFLTLTPPTKPMEREAAAAGLYEMEGFTPVPRIQIVTVEAAPAFRARAVRLPARRDDAFGRAVHEEDRGAQGKLDL